MGSIRNDDVHLLMCPQAAQHYGRVLGSVPPFEEVALRLSEVRCCLFTTHGVLVVLQRSARIRYTIFC